MLPEQNQQNQADGPLATPPETPSLRVRPMTPAAGPEPFSSAGPLPGTKQLTSAGNELVRKVFAEGLSHWLFRLGFASIFLVNSIYAALEPQSFTQLLYSNPIASAIGYQDIMVKVAMVNDMLLGVFILIGRRKNLVYAWAGIWLLIVAGIKLMNLVVG